jgi:hypothetical protein
MPPFATQPMTEEEKASLEAELAKFCEDNTTTEEEVDCKIKTAVDHLIDNLSQTYRKRPFFQKYRLGFVEISDIDRSTTSRLHKYITEKTKLVLFYEPIMRENFEIKDVQLESLPYAGNDQLLAEKLGQPYGVDLILTGVLTVSDNFVDMNLRMTESGSGRIVAVGTAKIDYNATVRQWYQDRI